MRVIAYTDADGLDSLKPAWDSLLATSTSHSVFQTWEWQWVWWNCFGAGKELRVLAVEDDSGSIIGFAPLYLAEDSPDETVVRFVGGTDVSDYLDIVASDGREGDVWNAVLAHLWEVERHPITLDLHCIRRSSATCDSVSSFVSSHGLGFDLQVENQCPVIVLPSDWEAYLSTLTKKDRHELRRKIRRIERETGSSVLKVVSDASTIERDVDDFLELHRKSALDKADFMDDTMRRFFQEISRVFLERGWLRLCFLEIESVRVASLMCFDYGEDLSVYNSGYDPAYSGLSVGIVLFGLCIRDTIERGRTHFDFLRGTEQYKYDLGGRDREIFQLLVSDQTSNKGQEGLAVSAEMGSAGCATSAIPKGNNA